MSAIKSKNTKPEHIVRSLLHRMGYRFRLHRGDLPGKPDIVLPRHGKIIEVYGCFWHMHSCKYGKVIPKTNTEFWQNKRKRNVERDEINQKKLKELDWDVMVIWECETREIEKLSNKLASYLGEWND
jgi:DNA mismatch endonuclease (patch repair protein)